MAKKIIKKNSAIRCGPKTQVEELLEEIHMRLGLETMLFQAKARIKELEAKLKRGGKR